MPKPLNATYGDLNRDEDGASIGAQSMYEVYATRMGLVGGKKAFVEIVAPLLREFYAQRSKLDALPSEIAPNLDTARMDFMERFIVEGSDLDTAKTAWLADVNCLRDTIDEAFKVAAQRAAQAVRPAGDGCEAARLPSSPSSFTPAEAASAPSATQRKDYEMNAALGAVLDKLECRRNGTVNPFEDQAIVAAKEAMRRFRDNE